MKKEKKTMLQEVKKCWVCGRRTGLECHHIFYGNAYRHLSEKYGLKVWLCAEHHRGNTGVHGYNSELRQRLMRFGQRKFEETHSRAEFMRVFGKNHLLDDEDNQEPYEGTDSIWDYCKEEK